MSKSIQSKVCSLAAKKVICVSFGMVQLTKVIMISIEGMGMVFTRGHAVHSIKASGRTTRCMGWATCKQGAVVLLLVLGLMINYTARQQSRIPSAR